MSNQEKKSLTFKVQSFRKIPNPYLKFITDGIVLAGLCFVIMWIKGFNAYEKSLFRSFIGRNKK